MYKYDTVFIDIFIHIAGQFGIWMVPLLDLSENGIYFGVDRMMTYVSAADCYSLSP